MKKRAVVIVGKGEQMQILLERRGQWILPNDFHLRSNYQMGDSKDKTTFLYGEKPFEVGDDFEWVPINQLRSLGENDGGALLEALALFWPGMPGFINDADLPKSFYKVPENSKELIFFGGSFNPWHKGHRTCLDLAAKMAPESHFIVVPDSNPWKDHSFEGCRFSFYRNLCEILAGTSYSVYPGFCGMSAPNPTIEWFPEVKAASKGLLLGDDSFFAIEEWKRGPELLGQIDRLLVVPRLESKDVIESFREEFLSRYSNIEIDILDEHPYADISSTALRTIN